MIGVVATAWWLAPAVVAAVITGVLAVVTLFVNGRRARDDRQRALFAEAFGDIAEYREYPYIVRRRRHDKPEAERARITADLSAVQHRLNRNLAVLRVEAPRVGRAYETLLADTRRVAGGAIRTGWELQPCASDAAVSIGDVDLTPLVESDDQFLTAAADHLAVTPGWVRRTVRAATSYFSTTASESNQLTTANTPQVTGIRQV